ncbi:hypothetical protein C0992_009252 [Termitomyces sp. T32_za158]|nr:hypothetical protein C0992_009252 [Termitomyces sp. T32_za158]
MAKSGKSSATSATRKKHAKKAAAVYPQEEQPPPPSKDKKLTKQQRAQKKKEPRVKVYIPPVKPVPVQPDPLETTGLAHRLPPELLIVLRSFNKKAQVTKIRALEELQSAWIDKCKKEGEDGALVYVLIDMLPVWLHHVSALFVHPSRRVRLLAAGVHLSFVQISPVRDKILSFLRDLVSVSQIESILGTWCLAAHDIDKSVAGTALKSWIDVFTYVSGPRDQLLLDNTYLPSLVSFTQRTILDPNAVYLYLNPPQPAAPAPPGKKGMTRKEEPADTTRSKADELEESDTDRKARLRIGCLGAIRRIVETLQPTLSDEICSFVAVESFGHSQPNVRKSAWALILSLLSVPKPQLEPLLPLLSVAVLRSAWVDSDTTVHAVMWQPLLKFLKEFPNAWELERAHDYSKDQGEEDSDDESSERGVEAEKLDMDPTATKQSAAYQEFLRFLELGCSGSPLQGYPTVVIIVSTIPSSILASSPTTPPLEALFMSFWQVLSSRALSSLQRAATSAAFLSSLLECLVFLVKRVRNTVIAQTDQVSPTSTATVLFGTGSVEESTGNLVREQIGKVWMHLVEGDLKVEHRAAARVVAQTLIDLREVDMGLFSSAWELLSARLCDAAESHPGLLSAFLKVFYDKFKHLHELKEAVSSVMSTTLGTSVQRCNESLNTLTPISTSHESPTQTNASPVTGIPFLIDMLEQFREGLFEDPHFAELIDALHAQHATLLLHTSPALLLSYLTHRKSPRHCSSVWHALLAGIARQPDLHAAELNAYVRPLLDAAQRGILPEYLKPKECEVDSMVQGLVERALAGDGGEAWSTIVMQVLQSPDNFLSENGYITSLRTISSAFSRRVDWALQNEDAPLGLFEPSLGLITALSRSPPRELPSFRFDDVLCDIFVLAYLLPACYDAQQTHPVFASARTIWEDLYKTSPAEAQAEIRQQINTKLNIILCNPSFRPFPEDMLEMARKPSGITFNLLHDIFPSAREIEQALSQLSPDPIHPSLAVITPLIPPSSAFASASSESPRAADEADFDKRGFSSYARIVNALLRVFIEDRQVAKQNIWALRHFLALELYAQDFISVPGAWNRVFAPEAIHAGLETLIVKVEQIATYVLTSSTSERWREEALAAVLGLGNQPSSSQAATSGSLFSFFVDTIQRARDSDSSRETRIMRNVLQHVFHDVDKEEADRWLVLARKIEAPETSMAIVYSVTNFAPEPTRLDRYRNELAASLLGVPPAKANTEGLLTLRKLVACAPNSESDVVFLPQPRAVNITKSCQQWIASDEDVDEEVVSAITAVFYHLAPILQDMSGAHWELMFDVIENNLEMCHLVMDSSVEVQKMAYHFLALAAKKRTEYLVIEAGVDAEAAVNMDLSRVHLDLLQRNIAIEEAQTGSSGVQKAFKLDIWAVDEFQVECTKSFFDHYLSHALL